MKKICLLLLSILILMCGCEKERDNLIVEKDKDEIIYNDEVEVVDTYTDLNNTPIGIYSLQGNKLVKLTTFNTKLVVEKDINTFQIFPSNENEIYLNNGFGQSFYNEFIKYNSNNNLKIGFIIK